MTGRRKSVAVANLADELSERAQNIIEAATGDPVEVLSQKVGWLIKSESNRNVLRFHITRKMNREPQSLIIMRMASEAKNALPHNLLQLVLSFAMKHQLRLIIEVNALPQTVAAHVEKTYPCERTDGGQLHVLPIAA